MKLFFCKFFIYIHLLSKKNFVIVIIPFCKFGGKYGTLVQLQVLFMTHLFLYTDSIKYFWRYCYESK
nr:MAG TPA: hypothetical protein [Caudoviricetes sp.]